MTRTVLAFSGGLDTSFCVAWLTRERGHEVVSVCVDTGGFDAPGLAAIEQRALSLGAVEHHTVDAKQDVWDRFVTWLVMGDVLRGGVYPVSVAAERTAQAEAVARLARQVGASTVAHGSTGAGNDQVRFDAALAATAPELQVLAPIRELALDRQAECDYLASVGVDVDEATVSYSLNEGLFGTTIGGKETHDPWALPPESAYTMTVAPGDAVDEAEELVLGFEAGRAVSLDGVSLSGPDLVAALNARARPHGVGRGVHVGDTILGVKGRIAFEAPAALLLVQAHRELAKLVLTRWQSHWLRQAGDFYGMLLHEAGYHDPAMRDVEALLASANARVTGEVRLSLYKGAAHTVGARSPHALLDAEAAVYGETAGLWTGEQAAGFSRLHALQATLAARRDARVPLTHGGASPSPAPVTPAAATDGPAASLQGGAS